MATETSSAQQQPQAGAASDPQAGNGQQQPQAGAPSPQPQPSGQEPKVFDEAYVQSLRQESAGYRTKLQAAEAKLKSFEDAQLTAQQKAEKDATDAKQRAEQLEAKLRESSIRAEVAVQSVKLKIVDPDAAFRLLNQKSIEFDEDGQPKNVEAALSALVKEKPFLLGQATVTTNVNNPARTTTTTLTLEQIKQMSPAEINARWNEVQMVLAANGGA